MDHLKTVNINTDLNSMFNPQLSVPLLSVHMIPGTNYKFMLEFDDSQFVYLRNVETG